MARRVPLKRPQPRPTRGAFPSPPRASAFANGDRPATLAACRNGCSLCGSGPTSSAAKTTGQAWFPTSGCGPGCRFLVRQSRFPDRQHGRPSGEGCGTFYSGPGSPVLTRAASATCGGIPAPVGLMGVDFAKKEMPPARSFLAAAGRRPGCESRTPARPKDTAANKTRCQAKGSAIPSNLLHNGQCLNHWQHW